MSDDLQVSSCVRRMSRRPEGGDAPSIVMLNQVDRMTARRRPRHSTLAAERRDPALNSMVGESTITNSWSTYGTAKVLPFPQKTS
jgi:hypothetical protein